LKHKGYPGEARRNEECSGNKEILGFVPVFRCEVEHPLLLPVLLSWSLLAAASVKWICAFHRREFWRFLGTGWVSGKRQKVLFWLVL